MVAKWSRDLGRWANQRNISLYLTIRHILFNLWPVYRGDKSLVANEDFVKMNVCWTALRSLPLWTLCHCRNLSSLTLCSIRGAAMTASLNTTQLCLNTPRLIFATSCRCRASTHPYAPRRNVSGTSLVLTHSKLTKNKSRARDACLFAAHFC